MERLNVDVSSSSANANDYLSSVCYVMRVERGTVYRQDSLTVLGLRSKARSRRLRSVENLRSCRTRRRTASNEGNP